MIEVNFEAVKAKNIVTGKAVPIPAIKGKDGEDSVAREEIASIKSSLMDKMPITHIAEEMDIEDFLKMPDGLYYFKDWLNVDDSETEWSDYALYGFDGLVSKYTFENDEGKLFTITGYSYGAFYQFRNDNPIPIGVFSLANPNPKQKLNYGIVYSYDYGYWLDVATASKYDDRINNVYIPVGLATLDFAVKRAMTAKEGTKGHRNGWDYYPAWTEEEQKNAQIRLGITPSKKGEEYELIREFTVEEDGITSILIDTDNAGEPFELEKVYIEFDGYYSNISSARNGIYLSYDKSIPPIYFDNIGEGSNSMWGYEISKRGSYMYAEQVKTTIPTGLYNSVTNAKSVVTNITSRNITMFRFDANQSNKYAVGTHIKVFGIRA